MKENLSSSPSTVSLMQRDLVHRFAPWATNEGQYLFTSKFLPLKEDITTSRGIQGVIGTLSISSDSRMLVVTDSSRPAYDHNPIKRYFVPIQPNDMGSVDALVAELSGMPVGVVLGLSQHPENFDTRGTNTMHPEIIVPPINPVLLRKRRFRQDDMPLGNSATVVFQGTVIDGRRISLPDDRIVSWDKDYLNHLVGDKIVEGRYATVIARTVEDGKETLPLSVIIRTVEDGKETLPLSISRKPGEISSDRVRKKALPDSVMVDLENLHAYLLTTEQDRNYVRVKGSLLWQKIERYSFHQSMLDELVEQLNFIYQKFPRDEQPINRSDNYELARILDTKLGFRIDAIPHPELYDMIGALAQEGDAPYSLEMVIDGRLSSGEDQSPLVTAVDALNYFFNVSPTSNPTYYVAFLESVIAARERQIETKAGNTQVARAVLKDAIWYRDRYNLQQQDSKSSEPEADGLDFNELTQPVRRIWNPLQNISNII